MIRGMAPEQPLPPIHPPAAGQAAPAALTTARGLLDPPVPAAPRRRGGLAWISVASSAALIAACLYWVDPRRVAARLEATDGRWLCGFFALYALQVVLLGLRWSRIARQLDVPLGWRRASAEYALSMLLNQLLPTGFAGDGLRAVRHARRCPGRPFLQILEPLAIDRLSGQLGLGLMVLAGAPLALRAGWLRPRAILVGGAAAALLLVAGWGLTRLRPAARGWLAPIGGWVARSGGLLLSPRRARVHLPTSLLLVAVVLGQLYVAARAIGIALDARLLCGLGPLVLLAASMPSFFGGWGIREGASAILFAGAGLPASAGVAVSLVFGAFALVCALPGLVVLGLDARPANPSARAGEQAWTTAHALGMLLVSLVSLWIGLPSLIGVCGILSLSFLVVKTRGRWTPRGRFGAANAITALRSFFIIGLLPRSDRQAGWMLAATAVAILLLDAADGWMARRLGDEGPFGARYDMETDALFVLALAVALMIRQIAGPWVLLAGFWRYLYVLAPLIAPNAGREVPRALFYRLAYVLMVLSFLLALVLPGAWPSRLALLGTASVSASFLRSFWVRYAGPAMP
jgi:phosphatidylglycerophosphate synthase